MEIGDEVIEKSTGELSVIISMAEMAEMCYEIRYKNPEKNYTALRFARELLPVNAPNKADPQERLF